MKLLQCMSKKGSVNFSKLLAVLFTAMFGVSATLGIVAAFAGIDTTVFVYIIPATGAAATVSASFYYSKAKAENLSKQRIRYVLMKLLLREEITGDTYIEICNEIDNIDMVLEEKISSMTQETIDETTDNTTII